MFEQNVCLVRVRQFGQQRIVDNWAADRRLPPVKKSSRGWDNDQGTVITTCIEGQSRRPMSSKADSPPFFFWIVSSLMSTRVAMADLQ